MGEDTIEAVRDDTLDLLGRVSKTARNAAVQLALATEERNKVILLADRSGLSARKIATACQLSHQAVMKVLRAEDKRKRDAGNARRRAARAASKESTDGA